MANKDTKRDHIAVVAPSMSASLIAPAVHSQAMRRIQAQFGFPVVEYPSVRAKLTAEERAQDINNASTSPNCKAIFAVVGGNDAITVTPHLDREILAKSKAPFVGYSDNTAIHNFLWKLGRTSYYGGSTQVQLGPGPIVDSIQLDSLNKILSQTGSIDLLKPTEYEVRGKDWNSPLSLTETGYRASYPEFMWGGKPKVIQGKSWGGCLQTLLQLAIIKKLPDPEKLRGAILFLELSDDHLGDGNVLKFIRAFGEAGYFSSVGAVLFGLPPHSEDQGEVQEAIPNSTRALGHLSAISVEIGKYNEDLLRVLGLPIGHLRPQYVIPYGGTIRVDGVRRVVTVCYEPKTC